MEALEDRRILIDTSIILDHFRQRGRTATQLQKAEQAGKIFCISAMTLYEVEAGAKVAGRQSDFDSVTFIHEIIDITRAIALEAATIFSELKRVNNLIEHRDILIAATARAHRIPLLTHNVSHFSRIAGLRVSDSVATLPAAPNVLSKH